MKSLKLVQIGDVHYPETVTATLVDLKDPGVKPALVNAVVANKLQNVLRKIVSLCDTDREIAGVLLCGDLTTGAYLPAYADCLALLNDTLDLCNAGRWPRDHIHAVPGNHDVDRDLCDPDGIELFSKFEPLADQWANLSLPVLATSAPRSTTVTLDGRSVHVSSLNSCVGCGEQRFLPEGIRGDLKQLLDSYSATAPPVDALSLLSEQLDTPAFVESHITEIKSAIESLGPNSVSVVLAHHNLLPQAIPRVAIYTEVINGGLVRSRLSRCHRPVVYCHGHIHDDPIEIIACPRNGVGPLISISAPRFDEGFNILDFQFGRQGVPLGCEVIPYRVGNDGSPTQEVDRVSRIQLQPTRRYSHVGHERIKDVVCQIGPDEIYRFPQILDLVHAATGQEIRVVTVADALREAEWFGFVTILNRQDEPKHWQVQRIGP